MRRDTANRSPGARQRLTRQTAVRYGHDAHQLISATADDLGLDFGTYTRLILTAASRAHQEMAARLRAIREGS